MKKNLSFFGIGFLFALGLGISGMTEPEKVIGFLNVFGSWDPSLIFVMMGAISIHFVSYKLIRNKQSPLLSTDWHVPQKKSITPSLIFGSFIFGVGWALAGYCPGPAITSLGSFSVSPLIFVASMILGMILFNIVDKKIMFNK